jgi:glutathione synthase/RimK-type ligase-like ATP-grasp enzyme
VIVVISHPADLHAGRVVERLLSWGRDVFLLDIADFPNDATVSVDFGEPAMPRATVNHRDHGSVDVSGASAVWWRRPQFVRLEEITDDDARGFAHGEWHEALHGLYALLECPWMNPPQADELASHKAHQLRVASTLGMRVPDTLMTSDPEAARAFIERHGPGGTIHKIFAATYKVWRETRVVREQDLALLESVRLAPVIFQERIPAVADVRVTVVGGEVFPMAIDTRHTGYDVDFRINMARARTSAIALPDDVVEFLHRLMDRLGIVYGAVDFRLTPEGEYVFLEINPAGEFLFVEQGAGHPITDAVAGWLAEPLGPML